MTRPALPGTWTDERLVLLAEIKDSAPKGIWEKLNKLPGLQLTKAAVIGMRDRLFMERRPKRTLEEIAASLLAQRERDNASRRAKRAKIAAEKTQTRTPVNLAQIEAARERARLNAEKTAYVCIEAKDIVPLHLSMMDLTDQTCRWPYGDGQITFCGHLPSAGRPYCLSHCAIAYTLPATRKRPDHTSQSSVGLFGQAA